MKESSTCQVAWLAPARKANPFQSIKSVDYGSGGNLNTDEENADNSQNADAQMASAGGTPDVDPEADAQGRVSKRARVARAIPVATPKPRGFFERLFGVRHEPAQQPTPPPRRRRPR